MATSLGGEGSAQIIINCYFGGAVSAGEPVELTPLENATATTTLDSTSDVVPVVDALANAGSFFGCAKYDTAADEMGPVVVYGLVKATAGGTIDKSSESRIQFQTDAKCDAYSSGDVHGVALEDSTDTNPVWVLINQFGAGGSFGVEH